MLKFLRICRPLDDENYFKRMLIRPLKNAEPAGAELLRVRLAFRHTYPLRHADAFLGSHELNLHSTYQGGSCFCVAM